MADARGGASPEPLEVEAIVVAGPAGALDRPETLGGSSYKDPVGSYLASLSTEKSRRTAIESMRRIARILGVQKDPRDHDAWRRIPWTSLTYAETNMVRAALVSTSKPATARLTISVLRRVLQEAFKLMLVGAEQYQRAILLQAVRGQSARPGRELTREDMERLEKHFLGLPEPFQSMMSVPNVHWYAFARFFGAKMPGQDPRNASEQAMGVFLKRYDGDRTAAEAEIRKHLRVCNVTKASSR